MSDISEAKRRLPLPALMEREGLGECAKRSARCPFHDDHHNSFSVWKNGTGLWRWKCHAGCGEGDEITFLQIHRDIRNSDATKLFLEMAGAIGAIPAQPFRTERNIKIEQKPLDWSACVEAFSAEHGERLAAWRGYSIEFCLGSQRGLQP